MANIWWLAALFECYMSGYDHFSVRLNSVDWWKLLACLPLVYTTRNAIIRHEQNKIEPTELIPHAVISYVLQVGPFATISTFDHRHKSTTTHISRHCTHATVDMLQLNKCKKIRPFMYGFPISYWLENLGIY